MPLVKSNIDQSPDNVQSGKFLNSISPRRFFARKNSKSSSQQESKANERRKRSSSKGNDMPINGPSPLFLSKRKGGRAFDSGTISPIAKKAAARLSESVTDSSFRNVVNSLRTYDCFSSPCAAASFVCGAMSEFVFAYPLASADGELVGKQWLSVNKDTDITGQPSEMSSSQSDSAVSFAFSSEALGNNWNLDQLLDSQEGYSLENVYGGLSKRVVMASGSSGLDAVSSSLDSSVISGVLIDSSNLPWVFSSMCSIANKGLPLVIHSNLTGIETHPLHKNVVNEDGVEESVLNQSGIQNSLSACYDYSQAYKMVDTGFIIFVSDGSSPQEVHDMAILCHLISLKSSRPVLHLFDAGSSASFESSKMKVVDMNELKTLTEDFISGTLFSTASNSLDTSAVSKNIWINSSKQKDVGGQHEGDSFGESALAISNEINRSFYELQNSFSLFSSHYKTMEYFGHSQAHVVFVCLAGTISSKLQDTISDLKSSLDEAKGSNELSVGLLCVRVVRPWSEKHFVEAVPRSVRKIVIVEAVSSANVCAEDYQSPLFMDVTSSFYSSHWLRDPNSSYYLGNPNSNRRPFITTELLQDCSCITSELIHQTVAKHCEGVQAFDEILKTQTKSSPVAPENEKKPDDKLVKCIFWDSLQQADSLFAKSAFEVVGESAISTSKGFSPKLDGSPDLSEIDFNQDGGDISDVIKNARFSSFVNSYGQQPCRASHVSVVFGEFPNSAETLAISRQQHPQNLPDFISSPDIVFCSNADILKSQDLVRGLCSSEENTGVGKALVINASWGISSEDSEDALTSNLDPNIRLTLKENGVDVYVFDCDMACREFLKEVGENEDEPAFASALSNMFLEICALKVIAYQTNNANFHSLLKCIHERLMIFLQLENESDGDALYVSLEKIVENVIACLFKFNASNLFVPEDHEYVDTKLAPSFKGNFLSPSCMNVLKKEILKSTLKGLLVTGKFSSQLSTSSNRIENSHSFRKFHEAFWFLMFPEAYNHRLCLRPDEPHAKLVKVTENRRLTPLDYDRNVFHIEFDTTIDSDARIHSGCIDPFLENRGVYNPGEASVKYEIGDALGVHGHNDPKLVTSFLEFYGLEEHDMVCINRTEALEKIKKQRRKMGLEDRSKELNSSNEVFEVRTVQHLFTQVLDLFGRPSKRFYESLANHPTTSVKHREELLYIISKEGQDEFKRRTEDTVTFADLLREFDSSHPSVTELVDMVPAIKPRHYSISSSMRMFPNSVHLLVVLVDWKRNSNGELRVGQCTNYLSNLTNGKNVTVTIKPSVMRLPPRSEQPVIMSGLGTGMAPFRAFIQERAMEKREGKDVGPMVLYFGSRFRGMEYLYGEELEAYHHEGVLNRLRLAFSRDQKKKVYIQHKIKEDKNLMWQYLQEEQGHFYLCGPTWPAGDVKDAIIDGFTSSGNVSEKEANDALNEMKEDERYVLEVY
eukprot:Nk52_evm59s210 gene=Nk52_evmTU59s210